MSGYRIAVCIVCGVLLLGGAIFTAYRSLDVAALRSGFGAAGAPIPPDDPFLELARKAGVRTCSTLFSRLGRALTNGSQFETQVEWVKEGADRNPLQAIVGMIYKDATYSGLATGVIFTSPGEDNCEGTTIRIVPFPQPCEAMNVLLPAGSKQTASLSGIPLHALPDGWKTVFMPSGTGCAAISILSAVRQ